LLDHLGVDFEVFEASQNPLAYQVIIDATDSAGLQSHFCSSNSSTSGGTRNSQCEIIHQESSATCGCLGVRPAQRVKRIDPIDT
jgi:hypothetical protein